jgi:hypothetical protein
MVSSEASPRASDVEASTIDPSLIDPFLSEGPSSSTAVEEMIFDSHLMWPDSEDLLQTIASFEESTQLSSSVMAYPLALTATHGGDSLEPHGAIHDRGMVGSLSTVGEQAVQNLSQMVSAVVSI